MRSRNQFSAAPRSSPARPAADWADNVTVLSDEEPFADDPPPEPNDDDNEFPAPAGKPARPRTPPASLPEPSLSSLRQLLATRFPTASHPTDRVLPTGIDALDAPAGGLAVGGVTEIVCGAPSCGGQLAAAQILATTRAERRRAAWVETGDGFDPASYEPEQLRHLVWVRANCTDDALAAADLLVNDANLALVMLDLRAASAAELRRVPAPTWFRFQRAVESGELAFLVFTPRPLVASARLRLVLAQSLGADALDRARPALAAALAPTVQRQRAGAGQRVG